MRHLCALLAMAALAQEQPADQAATRRQKAMELLESSAKMVTAAQQEVQVAGLFRLGETYELVDRNKAVEYLEQAFAGAAELPSSSEHDQRSRMQSRILMLLASLDLEAAMEKLRTMPAPPSGQPDQRRGPTFAVVRLLLEKRDFDRAMEIVESVGSAGEYPFGAAQMVFEKLEADDARRTQLFAAATAAFASRPGDDFYKLLERHWQAVPRPMAESALQAVINAILDKKDDVTHTANISTAKGTVTFNSRVDRELFNLMNVIQAIDPKRATELLEKRPELKAAVERFPQGIASMAGEKEYLAITYRIQQKRDPQTEARDRLNAIARSRVAEAAAVLKEDPRKALAMAPNIPVPEIRMELVERIARTVNEKDSATAKSVLDESMRLLEEIKDPAQRIRVWEILVESAHHAQEEQRAREAIDRWLADAAELYRRDNDPENPNRALRDQWPSTAAYRRIASRAASLFGVEAEALLTKITDPDVALLARIEMARALLGRADAGRLTTEFTPAKRR